MTKTQRARVVELLRCAADNAGRAVFLPLLTAIDDCDASINTKWHAFKVYSSEYSRSFKAWPVLTIPDHERETQALLESTQRVEEGSWP